MYNPLANMPTGTLVHITAARKLMIKISEKTYDSIYNRLYNESKKKNFPTERLAVYSRENDDGEEEHFAMVTPDKYDRQNMPKLEKLETGRYQEFCVAAK